LLRGLPAEQAGAAALARDGGDLLGRLDQALAREQEKPST
jgi:hypothetical protein